MHFRRPPPKLMRWIALSLLIHSGFGVVCYVLSTVRPKFFDDRKIIAVNLVQKGKKRDEALLPRQVSEAPKIEATKVVKDEPSPPPVVVSGPAPVVVEKHKIEKPKVTASKPVAQRVNALDALQKRIKSFEKEGNENGLERGNSVVGELSDAYESLVLSILYDSFLLPTGIRKNEIDSLVVTILIKIGPVGELIDVKVVTPSRNADFDHAVLANVKGIASFGPPPIPIRQRLKRDGLEIDMCPTKCPRRN